MRSSTGDRHAPGKKKYQRRRGGTHGHGKQHRRASQAAMWRKAVTAALALGTGAGAAAIATSDDPAKTLKICTHLPPRLLRDSVAAATIAFDYQYSLWGLEPDSKAWTEAKKATHLRSANRLQELCFRNGGIYIKLGQHIAQLVRNSNSISSELIAQLVPMPRDSSSASATGPMGDFLFFPIGKLIDFPFSLVDAGASVWGIGTCINMTQVIGKVIGWFI